MLLVWGDLFSGLICHLCVGGKIIITGRGVLTLQRYLKQTNKCRGVGIAYLLSHRQIVFIGYR